MNLNIVGIGQRIYKTITAFLMFRNVSSQAGYERLNENFELFIT